MKENFNIGSSNNEDCDADLIYVFYSTVKQPDGLPDLVINDFVEKKMVDFVTDLEEPGKISYLLKVGSSSALLWTDASKTSNVIRNDITICGKETLVFAEDGA